jgi:hypothetical protein
VHVIYPGGHGESAATSSQGVILNVEDLGTRLRVRVLWGIWEGERVFVRQAEVVNGRHKFCMLSDMDSADREWRADTRASESECRKLYGVPVHRAAIDRCFHGGLPAYGPQGRVATLASAYIHGLRAMRRELMAEVLDVGNLVRVGDVEGFVRGKEEDYVVIERSSGDRVRVKYTQGQTAQVLQKATGMAMAGSLPGGKKDIGHGRDELRTVRRSLESLGYVRKRRPRMRDDDGDGDGSFNSLMAQLLEAKRLVEEKGGRVKGT